MKLCNILLLIFIIKIYTTNNLPGVCHDASDNTKEVPCVADSAECQGTTAVGSSNPTKAIDNGKCYDFVPNCEKYNPNWNTCYKCNNGYEIKVDDSNNYKYKCIVEHCDNNGMDNTDKTKCTKCIYDQSAQGYAYVLSNDGRSCNACNNGKSYSTDGISCPTATGCYRGNAQSCLECAIGYYMNNNVCTICPDGKTTDSEGATAVSSCYAKVPGCSDYDSSNNYVCKQCDSGKYLKTVTTNGNTVISCVDCNGSNELKGKNLNNYDTCYEKYATGSGTDGCAGYSDSSTCRKCESEYLGLFGGQCVPCVDPYISDGYHCYKKVEHCASYYYNCYSGICYSSCNSCEDGYKGDNGECKKICQDCNAGNGEEDGSSANTMKLSILYMMIMLIILA